MANHKDAAHFARRSFIKDGGLIIAGGAIGSSIATQASSAAVANRNTEIRIGVLGCGRRAKEVVSAAIGIPGFKVTVAGLADRFGSQTQSMFRMLKGRHADHIEKSCIRASGQDALDQLLVADIDAIYVTTPPVERAAVVRKIVAAGKHVFLEKPLSSDLEDVLAMNAIASEAQRQRLTIHTGFQRRYDPRVIDSIEQFQAGLIGDPVFAKAYCNGGPLRKRSTRSGESADEYRIKNWNHFVATGGDFLVEQHVAGLDLIRLALGKMPVAAQGQGGWSESRPMESAENEVDQLGREVFDHQTVEYDFGDVMLLSQCRRVAKGWNALGESIHGTKGILDLAAGKAFNRNGDLIWESSAHSNAKANTLAQQNAFLTSIRDQKAETQIESAAQSTLIALLGQQATISKRRVRMDQMLVQAVSQMS
ncbi:Gfo/Idh/MocA family oxidoreductase [Stieleria sp. JC731]|uniref:Gfo/Idh/MocA family protein n=1 Tax=Pirellulaceae TaxID=2691357 RepID=UPI001E468AEF|nr:Gfo/Idh/MocA family oxidoreductase [Stieleria sp. JC731]MCC9602021.1 Gfo/Idh/MocA family oxidoreductase [Stieleria sp. JC731]